MLAAQLVVPFLLLAGVSATNGNGNGHGNGGGNGNVNGNGSRNGNGTSDGNGNNSQPQAAQVIILGGGISGISAARSLMVEHNITDILLIEARPELGGRAHTETLHNKATGADVVVEKGCNWIQGPGKEPIQELAQKWGLKTARTNYSDTVWFAGGDNGETGQWLDADAQEAFMGPYDNFLENAPGYSGYRTNNSLVDISVRVATSIMDWIPLTPLQQLYEYWNIDFTFAQSPEESSFNNAFGQEAGIENEVDDFVIDQRGYKYLFVQEARQLFGDNLDDPRLKLSTVVKSIDYSGSSIVVTTDQGTFSAPHVVVTFSVGVLQHQDVQFVPRLPDWKKEAIFTFAMAVYQKIFLLFEKQFWGASQWAMYADPDERGRYAVWQNINADGFFPQGTQNNVFMVTATDEIARRNEQMTDAEITAEIMPILREMYGGPDAVPDPVDILVPRWSIDPLYRGSYSNWPLGAMDEHHANLGQPIVSGNNWLHFSGEATSSEMFGYVQGAWDQGLKAAADVAACLGGQCPKDEVYEALTTCAQTETNLSKRNVIKYKAGGSPRRHSIPRPGTS